MRPRLLPALGLPIFIAVTVSVIPTAHAATPTVTITWDGDKFTSTPTIASGTIVKWRNDGSGGLAGIGGDGTLTVTYKSGPSRFSTVNVAHGATSSGTTINGGSAQANEVVNGHDQSGSDRTGTIVVKATPASPKPSPTHSTTSPKPTHSSSSKASPSAAPIGVVNPPPLGVGVASPSPSPAGPGPLVAAAPPDELPTPEPSVDADVPPTHALAQSVPARKLGLPGALAAVLLTGVVVGVVRLARVEFGNGNGYGNGPVGGHDSDRADVDNGDTTPS